MPPPERSQTFGEVAIEKRYLTADQLDEGLRLQKKLKGLGLKESLGEILVKKGYLSAEQVKEILKTQGHRSGTQIPGYKILEKLGAGGMGSVYKAIQISMDRPVAIKILSKDMARKGEMRERFLREGRMAARLNHPNVVAAYDVGVSGDHHYLIMEFVEGESLQDKIKKEGVLPEARALDLWLQVTRALGHAAENNMVHRDVKPGNILVTPEGRAKLADLGLARPIQRDDNPEITQPGTAIGTPWYISPEQARGESDLDVRTDIYSLGATFYHLLTGRPPFDGTSGAMILSRHLTDPPEAPDRIRPGLTQATCRHLLRCLEKDREDRFESPAALARALEEAIGSPSRRGGTTPSPAAQGKAMPAKLPKGRRSRKSVRHAKRRDSNNWLWAAMLAGVISALALLLLFS